MIATDYGEARAAEIIGGYLRKWTWPRTPAEQHLIDIAIDLAAFSFAIGQKITTDGATLPLAALQAKNAARLADCLAMLQDISPATAHITFMLEQADNLGLALLALAEPEGEA